MIMAKLSEGSCLHCCGICKTLFVNSKLLQEHRRVCLASTNISFAVQAQETLEILSENGMNQDSLIQDAKRLNSVVNPSEGRSPSKRSRGWPHKQKPSDRNERTIFVEMIEMPPTLEVETKMATISSGDEIIQQEELTNQINFSEDSLGIELEEGARYEVIVLNEQDSDDLETVEITVGSQTGDEDDSVAYLHIPNLDSMDEVSIPPVDHDTRLKQINTRYNPRNEAPKETDYTVRLDKGREIFDCNFCSYKSKHLHMLGRHITTHNDNGQPFVCELCQFQCMFRGLFQAHQKKHQRPHKCERCSYCSSNVRDLQRHNLRHQGAMPFQCDQCDKRFRQKQGLEIHKRTHTGQLFKCGIDNCEYQTPNQQTLRSHQVRKHNEENLDTYLCSCGYSSKDRATFNFHQKSHLGLKDHKCPYCSYTAIKASEVKRHMKRHMEEKLYHCKECAFKTAHASALKNHLMGHENMKPYSCSLCSYSHASKTRIQHHMESQHPGEPIAIIFDGYRLKVDLESYRGKVNEKPEDRVIKLKYGIEQKEAITIDENQTISNVTLVTGLVVQSSQAEDEVGTFRCEHCRYSCFSDSALASHGIQFHEENLCTERQEIVLDSAMVDALVSVQAQMDVETS